MRRTGGLLVTAACVAALLVQAAPVAATTEVLVARAQAYIVLAHRGWLSWEQSDTTPEGHVTNVRVLQHAGRTTRLSGGSIWLGTGPSGGTVAIIQRCRNSTLGPCKLLRHNLATGSELTLLSPPQPLLGAAESKGLLAYAREDRGIYGVRRGSRHARRLTRDAGTIHGLNSRWLLYEEVQPTFSDRPHEIKVLDLRTRRTRVLATDDRFDSDCRCVNRVTEIAGAALDGNFAYWRVLTYDEDAGTGFNLRWFVYRADLRHPKARLQFVEVAQGLLGGAQSISVDGGAIYYSNESRGVFRVDAPTWQTSPQSLPLRG